MTKAIRLDGHRAYDVAQLSLRWKMSESTVKRFLRKRLLFGQKIFFNAWVVPAWAVRNFEEENGLTPVGSKPFDGSAISLAAIINTRMKKMLEEGGDYGPTSMTNLTKEIMTIVQKSTAQEMRELQPIVPVETTGSLVSVTEKKLDRLQKALKEKSNPVYKPPGLGDEPLLQKAGTATDRPTESAVPANQPPPVDTKAKAPKGSRRLKGTLNPSYYD